MSRMAEFAVVCWLVIVRDLWMPEEETTKPFTGLANCRVSVHLAFNRM